MDIFEYLPQLIVAYDGNDEFANLIHVKKADKDRDYYCPCCSGTVKPRALDSNKEQSHYYHKTGKCTKESQLHFFCKNWLFGKGSKFYINKELYEVVSIDIEKTHSTPFGDYKPDVTVYTSSGKTIFFEMFFFNRKTGDDYFCMWNALGHDVVEINNKEYMFKTDKHIIPVFTYLYHDGICYSKNYEKRDLYATTIAKTKRELIRQKVLNYKARIEQLDWFWQKVKNNETKEQILEVVAGMDYEDMVSCYSILKNKQCVSYLKNDVLEMINKKVISNVRKSINLPYDKNVYFDLRHVRGRTYEAGIRLDIKTEHITYNKLHAACDNWYNFDRLKQFPKIVFSKNILDASELIIPENQLDNLKKLYEYVVKYKEKILRYEELISGFEGDKYRVRVKNNLHTVLVKTESNDYEVLFDGNFIKNFDIDDLIHEINDTETDIENRKFLNVVLKSNEYNTFLLELKKYSEFYANADIGKYKDYCQNALRFKLYIGGRCVYDKELKRDFDDFLKKIEECDKLLHTFIKSHSTVIELVYIVNNCKNDLWKAQLLFDRNGNPIIEVDQKLFTPKQYLTLEKVQFEELDLLNKQKITNLIEEGMRKVLKNMERCGYRVMGVLN